MFRRGLTHYRPRPPRSGRHAVATTGRLVRSTPSPLRLPPCRHTQLHCAPATHSPVARPEVSRLPAPAPGGLPKERGSPDNRSRTVTARDTPAGGRLASDHRTHDHRTRDNSSANELERSGSPAAVNVAPPAGARYRFLARFGATILSGGVAAIPMALYHYQAALRLVTQEVWFVGYILAHRWTAALPYPSLRRMSRCSGVITQMLHRYKQSLIHKGYLVIIPRHRASGGRTSNSYDFTNLFQALEQLLLDNAIELGEANVFEAVRVPLRQRAADLQARPPAWRSAAPSQPPLPVAAPLQASTRTTSGVTGDGYLASTTDDAPSGPQERRPKQEKLRVSTDPPSPASAPRTTERALHNAHEHQQMPTILLPDRLALSPEPTLRQRWDGARRMLAKAVSVATFRAWVEPLELIVPDEAEHVSQGQSDGAPVAARVALRLGCASTFQREQLERRYRHTIAAACDARVEFVIRPATRDPELVASKA